MNTSLLHLGWPQLILLCLWLISLGVHIAMHGQPMGAMYNGWSRLIKFALLSALLAWGGFFRG
ncbi:MAG: hypothetical protein ACKVOO_12565 [Burkholderiaceae bacterium]